jgi:O-antigen chain-terminating methyltransferase
MEPMENQAQTMFAEIKEALGKSPEAPAIALENTPAEAATLVAIGTHWHHLHPIADPRAGLFERPEPKEVAKRRMLKLVRWLINPIIDTATAFNRQLLQGLALVTERLRRHEHRLNEMQNTVAGLAAELAAVKTESAARVKALEAASAHAERTNAFSLAPDAAFHFDYPRFEWKHRGSRELIKDLQRKYVPAFEGHGPVLDLGAGRGEFIEMLGEAGIPARGIEIDARQAAYCRDRGLDVATGDMFELLAEEADGSLGGIFLGQVVEHISPSQLIDLVRLAATKLRPGGCFVSETPNPACLFIFSSFFYLDPSHNRPVHPETMRYLLEVSEFSQIDIRFVHPLPDEVRLEKLAGDDAASAAYNRNIDRLNGLLYTFQDYAAIAYK